jgi:hypothetical protein
MVPLMILVLIFAMASDTVTALNVENVKTWFWTNNTWISVVVKGDVDGDGRVEMVTGGCFDDGARNVAQLCVWDGATLSLENVKTWYWTDDTFISSVAVGDVDADGKNEIVTAGGYYDGTRSVAQLCVWNGATLGLENVKTWYWTDDTVINSVAVGDVDDDGKTEIVTGGKYFENVSQSLAQLCVWNGATLGLENVKTWHWGWSDTPTSITSVVVGDVDGDGKIEIVTGGSYYDRTYLSQLCVWDGATLTLENVKTWAVGQAGGSVSVVVGDVDGDGKTEIVTGGFYAALTIPAYAELFVLDGATLATENAKTWQWSYFTYVWSVAIGDSDGDGQIEIITGGSYEEGPIGIAQLCVWDGTTLTLENVKTWYWISDTSITSVVVGDVDGDGKIEIVTGGSYYDGTRSIAQLCVWSQ